MKTKIILIALLVLTTVFLIMIDETEINEYSIRINEIVSNNTSVYQNTNGEYSDYIEVYNYGDKSVNLEGFGLSDDNEIIHKWTFPDIVIDSNEYLIINASGSDVTDMSISDIHTNFKLDKDGEVLLLSDNEGNIISSISFSATDANMSYGYNGSEYVYYLDASPGKENNGTFITDINKYLKFDKTVTPSVQPGIYSKPISLSFDNNTNYQIRYTLDGSDPTIESELYENEIPITFTDDLTIRISNIQCGFEETEAISNELINSGLIVKAQYFNNDIPMGNIFSGSYFIWEEGSDRYSLDIVSLTTDPDNLFNEDTGIYVVGKEFMEEAKDTFEPLSPANYNQRGREWERPANIEFFDSNGNLEHTQNIGVRIFGSWSRSSPKKSFRIISRDEYDDKLLNIDLYSSMFNNETSTVNEYKTLILRNGGNDYDKTIFRDILNDELAYGLLEYQAFKPVILFINGEYFGIYNIREYIDENYFADKYNKNPEDFEIIDYMHFKIEDPNSETKEFRDLYKYIIDEDMSSDINYDYIETKLDINNLIEYFIHNIYIDNRDWPHNNVKVYRYTGNDADLDNLYRFMVYDTDSSMSYKSESVESNFDSFEYLNSYTTSGFEAVFINLMENEEFKKELLSTLNNRINSNYSSENVSELIDYYEQLYAKEILENSQRWQHESIISVDDYSDKFVGTLKTFTYYRANNLMLLAAKNYDLHPVINLDISADMKSDIVVNDSYIIDNGDTQKIKSFADYTTQLDLVNPDNFSHWIIQDNGLNDLHDKIIIGNENTATITVKSDIDLVIKAVFK